MENIMQQELLNELTNEREIDILLDVLNRCEKLLNTSSLQYLAEWANKHPDEHLNENN